MENPQIEERTEQTNIVASTETVENTNETENCRSPPVPYPEIPRIAQPEVVPEEKKPEEEAGFLWKAASFIGNGIYTVLYETGGFLADFFGITRPRYEYALREYYERQREAELQERMKNGELDEFGNEIENQPEGTA